MAFVEDGDAGADLALAGLTDLALFDRGADTPYIWLDDQKGLRLADAEIDSIVGVLYNDGVPRKSKGRDSAEFIGS